MKKKKVGSLTITYQVGRYLDEVLERSEYDFMSYYPTVVDVGANIGTFSFYMYNRSDKIYALEPVKENIDCLLETVKENELTKIIPIQMAISDHSWVSLMKRDGDAGYGGWKLEENGDYPVDTRTLKDFMTSQNIEYIDLLKLDVEGEELKILSSSLFPYQKVGTIIGEYHSSESQKGTQEVLEWLGYKYVDLGSSHFLARK